MTSIPQSEALSILRSCVGKPYILGRNGPQAFDCSGLYYYWLRKIGFKTIDRTAASFYTVTDPVKGSPRFGDTVYLKSSYVYHMAVIGERMSNGDYAVYEAKGKRYGVVKTTLSFWRKRGDFAGVRRMKGITVTMPNYPSKYTGKKTDRKNLSVGKFSDIGVTLEYTNENTAMVYARIHYELIDPLKPGYAEIRMVRGNGDATGYNGIYLPPGVSSRPVTQFWRGSNARGNVSWQIRAMSNVKTAYVTTRYAKSWKIA